MDESANQQTLYEVIKLLVIVIAALVFILRQIGQWMKERNGKDGSKTTVEIDRIDEAAQKLLGLHGDDTKKLDRIIDCAQRIEHVQSGAEEHHQQMRTNIGIIRADVAAVRARAEKP